MRMFVAGSWVEKKTAIPVVSPFDGKAIGEVPRGGPEDVERAVASAVSGAKAMAAVPAFDRHRMLTRAAQLMAARAEELSRTISQEEGKVLAEGRLEVSRAVETITASAEEAKRIHGETIPVDAAPGGAGKLSFTLRVPCGVVAAVTPFNFPLNLVCHKVGPALAAGNSVVLKPATDTPLSALKLVEILLEAGVPPLAIHCVTGSGADAGEPLVSDPRIRKVSFTGSRDVGERITQRAGLKRVTLELGSNSPIIVMPDADPEKVADAVAKTGYSNAGQSCISAQRVLVSKKRMADVISALLPKVRSLRAGDPFDASVQVGPLIKQKEAARVQAWIAEAVSSGARVLVGGGRQGAVHEPTVVADVGPAMRLFRDELFGPAVGLTAVESLDEAIAMANDSRYGLSASIFTESLEQAMRFAREVEAGNLHVNFGPSWRADLQPYGGLKESGFGKEGPRYAVEEMTELKTVVLHLR
ncbi:MAG: aldehyde dehydrogenase family protein [Myxococcales bacterium]|nr:aldehyde dehydrogenase family protein [Myxococcales bacterium]